MLQLHNEGFSSAVKLRAKAASRIIEADDWAEHYDVKGCWNRRAGPIRKDPKFCPPVRESRQNDTLEKIRSALVVAARSA